MVEQLLVGLGLALIFTPALVFLSVLLKLYEHPNERRINSTPVPTAGGLGLYAAFLITAYWYKHPDLLAYFVGATIIVLTGLIDDYRGGLSAGKKFLGQIAAVIAFLALSSSPNYVIAAIFMVSVINITNFIDGLDGLATGIILIASVALLFWTYTFGFVDIAGLLMILIGGCLGFLAFNFHPAKIFLGDTGAMFLGFTFAALANDSVLSADMAFNLPLLVLILAVPTLDTFCAIVRRVQKGVPVYQADCQHFHHCLLELGFGQRQVALIAYMLTLTASTLALFLAKFQSWNLFLVLPVVAVIFLYGARRIGMIKPFTVKPERRVF
ncbi:MAG TPA: undecaprenyl/decaprenyl-phosphate alpha-N-acetylglucosaminyl 1-phosphate transferase [Firmicutes bacterium]|nr:undecaprenyl/decaprenyl-phosphate alpha-N-acetylglucosaminyl 1-phosphate transferase [Bacillota bacterium]